MLGGRNKDACYFLLSTFLYFFPNFRGKKLRNRICGVFPNLVHSLLIDNKCYARHQARWKERPLCVPPGDREAAGSLRAGWLAGYLGGAGIQGRISSPHNVHLSGALKTSRVERSEARVAPRGMEGRARAG